MSDECCDMVICEYEWAYNVSIHVLRGVGIPIQALGLEENTGCLTISLYALLRHFPKKNWSDSQQNQSISFPLPFWWSHLTYLILQSPSNSFPKEGRFICILRESSWGWLFFSTGEFSRSKRILLERQSYFFCFLSTSTSKGSWLLLYKLQLPDKLAWQFCQLHCA